MIHRAATPAPIRLLGGIACSVVGLASLGACSGGSSSTMPTAPTRSAPWESKADDEGEVPDSFEPSLSPWRCPTFAPSAARCNRVEVPADWLDPNGPTVSLPVVVIPATGPDRSPDAIVVPAGGPGGSMTDFAEHWSDPRRDIVLYDQRGTGAAHPNLGCPERDEAWLANLQRDAGFAVERAAIVDAYHGCRTRLEAEGIDLDDYDTEASVRDLDAIRAALGYDQWNILGISYGSRLALAAMRSTPQGIRSVILDSVYDVTAGGLAATQAAAERALGELVQGCSESAACADAHPDLADEIGQIQQRYNDSPIHVDVDLGDGDGPRTFVITGDDALGGLFQAMYDPSLIPSLPGIIGDLAAGDTVIVGELVRQNVKIQGATAWGMYLSVNCADNAGLPGRAADLSAIEHPGRFRALVTEPLCSDWPVDPTSAAFNAPVASDLPSLVVAGRFDPVTPPAGSKAVASRLTNSTFALWPNRGHGVTGDPCAEQIMAAFLEHPAASVDLGCLKSVPDPRFS